MSDRTAMVPVEIKRVRVSPTAVEQVLLWKVFTPLLLFITFTALRVSVNNLDDHVKYQDWPLKMLLSKEQPTNQWRDSSSQPCTCIHFMTIKPSKNLL